MLSVTSAGRSRGAQTVSLRATPQTGQNDTLRHGLLTEQTQEQDLLKQLLKVVVYSHLVDCSSFHIVQPGQTENMLQQRNCAHRPTLTGDRRGQEIHTPGAGERQHASISQVDQTTSQICYGGLSRGAGSQSFQFKARVNAARGCRKASHLSLQLTANSHHVTPPGR